MVAQQSTPGERGVALLLYACVEQRHIFGQERSLAAPLLLRQTTWCAAHDCPAVLAVEPVDQDRQGAAAP
jgi:hypothetical protein